MRTTVAVLAVCGVAASILAAVAQSGVQRRPAPSLRIAEAKPLTVVGRNFRRHERVRISATLGGRTRTLALHASTAGRFKVIFRRVGVSRCDALRVVAKRSSGALVVVKRLPAPACSVG